MKMPKTIFDQLLDILAIIAVLANGREPDEEEKTAVEEYARKEALSILDAWAEAMEEEWEIISD